MRDAPRENKGHTWRRRQKHRPREKESRDDSLGTGVIHGDEDEKASIQKKESQISKNAEQMRAGKSEAEAKMLTASIAV